MRFLKMGVVMLATASASVLGAGMAQADQTVTVTAKLATCAVTAGVDVNLQAKIGQSITLSDENVAKLKARGCL